MQANPLLRCANETQRVSSEYFKNVFMYFYIDAYTFSVFFLDKSVVYFNIYILTSGYCVAGNEFGDYLIPSANAILLWCLQKLSRLFIYWYYWEGHLIWTCGQKGGCHKTYTGKGMFIISARKNIQIYGKTTLGKTRKMLLPSFTSWTLRNNMLRCKKFS